MHASWLVGFGLRLKIRQELPESARAEGCATQLFSHGSYLTNRIVPNRVGVWKLALEAGTELQERKLREASSPWPSARKKLIRQTSPVFNFAFSALKGMRISHIQMC